MTPLDPIDAFSDDLDASAREELERRLREDAAFRDEVDRLRPVVDALSALPDEAWDPPAVGPPPALSPEPRDRPIVEPRRPWWALPRLTPLAAAGFAVVTLLAGITLGWLIGQGDRTPAPAGPTVVGKVTLNPLTAEPAAHGTATMLADRRLEIDAAGLSPNRNGAVYTVWLLNRDMTMEPVGSFQVGPDGAAKLTMPMPYDAKRFDFVDISVEPDDGVPTHSGKSVLRAEIT